MDYFCITKLSELKKYLSDSKIISFDIETAPCELFRNEERAALDPHKAFIVGISFSVSEGSAIYVPLRHKLGNNVDDIEQVMNYLKNELFENKSIIKVAHNISFESMFMYKNGLVLQMPVYDTIAAAQLTLKNQTEFRNLSDSGLKTLVPNLLHINLPSFSDVTKGKHFDELDPQDYETVRYACADSDYTLRLYYLFNQWFDAYLLKHRYIVENIESPTAVYIGIMKYNGISINLEIMKSKQIEAKIKINQTKSEIQSIIGDVDIGENASTTKFKNYLFKNLKLPILKTTTNSKESTDDESLILLKDWCKDNRPELIKLFELIQYYRKLQKLKATYIDGYLKHINSATGKIHCDFLPLGTETGRFASRNPNLQNCPRADGDIAGIRKFFIPSPGNVLISLDFSQIELRVGAFYCRDTKMLETYKNGGDIHAQTTSVIFHIPFERACDKSAEHYKERRTIAKNCNFGVFFGLFPKGLQHTLKFKAGLDTSFEECETIVRNIKAGYSKLSTWQNQTIKVAHALKYSQTYLGRRRYLPSLQSTNYKLKSYGERCALNTPIQGTAADILKLAIVRILAGLNKRPWIKPLLQIHDELVFEVPEDKVYEAINFIKSCMEEKPFEDFDVPIVAEASVGATFGDMKEV